MGTPTHSLRLYIYIYIKSKFALLNYSQERNIQESEVKNCCLLNNIEDLRKKLH